MDALKQQILDAALPLIAFEGWSLSTLEKAAVEAELSKHDVARAFPNGVIDCLNYFTAQADIQMEETLKAEYSLDTMRIRDRIATMVMVRLQQNLKHREAVRRGLAFYALPWNAGHGMKSLYQTVDTMWRLAGDTSTDFNFYTKRGLLAKVYMATLTVWLDDESDDLATTQAFLYRRIEDVMKIEKLKASCKDMAKKTPFSALFT